MAKAKNSAGQDSFAAAVAVKVGSALGTIAGKAQHLIAETAAPSPGKTKKSSSAVIRKRQPTAATKKLKRAAQTKKQRTRTGGKKRASRRRSRA